MNLKSIVLSFALLCIGLVKTEAQITGYLNFKDAMDAVPICDLANLDGKSGSNPAFVSTKGSLPCAMSGGKEDNMIIFPFIATASEIEIRIRNQSCTSSSLIGLQAGFLQDTISKNCLALYLNDLSVGSLSDITLSSNSFIPGNRYFLWIDGNGGSMCNFTLNISKGNIATPTLKEIAVSENILNGLMVDSILTDTVAFCVGPDSLEIEVPSDGLNLSYTWIIEPALPNVGTPTIIDTTNKIKLFFNALGGYDVKVVASNGCTDSDTLRMHVIVSDKPSVELFPDLDICPEDLASIPDILRKYDPNGDGIFGWGVAFVPISDTVRASFINKFNCNIDQLVKLTILDSPQPGRDTVVVCDSYDNNGSIITSSQEIRFFPTIPAANGCDTSVNRYIYIPKISGRLLLKICERNMQDEIAFVADSSSILPGTTYTFTWFKDGMESLDTDGIDSLLKLMDAGDFTLRIDIDYNGFKCTYTLPEVITYEGKGLQPAKPTITIENVVFCPDDKTIRLKATSDKADKFNWTLPANAVIVFESPNRDSLNVDLGSIDADVPFKVAVSAENGCGKTGDVESQELIKISKPNLDFNLPEAGCIGNSALIVVDSMPTPGYNYTWDISPARLQSGSLNVYDDIGFSYGTSGTFRISLSATHATCGTYDTSRSLSVYDPLVYVTPQCRSNANTITISWPGQPCVDQYDVIVNGVSLGVIDTLEYQLTNLNSDTSVSFEILALNSCGCDSLSLFATCSTLDCGLIDITTTIDDSVICEKDPATLTIYTDIPIFYTGGRLTYSGDSIDQNGTIRPGFLTEGKHPYLASYEYQGCIVERMVNLLVKGKPKVQLELDDDYCESDNDTNYSIISDLTNQNTYRLDGQSVGSIGKVSIGISHKLMVTDQYGCTDEISFMLDEKAPLAVAVLGDIEIFENEILRLNIQETSGSKIDSAKWLINGVSNCQTALCDELIKFNQLPGNYNHNIKAFVGKCSTDIAFVVVIFPSVKIFIPNAFSPNALEPDNKIFSIFTNGPDGAIKSLKIYSRWGELVCQKNAESSSEINWDGTMQGKPLQTDVYVYQVEYLDEKGILRSVVGDVTMF